MQVYDAIVIGAGGVGSAALRELARRGQRVLGIDRFNPPHDRGSSHGQTRIIRQAYFEHPDYVPLARRSYELWSKLEHDAAQKLFAQVGLLEVGPADGIVVPGVLRAARLHDLSVEELTPAEVARRWPQFRLAPGTEAVFEPTAGFLRVEACVAAHLAAAQRDGAELAVNTLVQSWSSDRDVILVKTDRGDFRAQRLVITAGPWASQLLGELGVPLTVRRKSLFWFAADETFHVPELPTFLFELPYGVVYGFPAIDDRGLKVAEHSGGQTVADPLAVNRDVDPSDEATLREFLAAHLPGVSSTRTDHAVCMYTMSPDEHFIVDRHPADRRIVFAAGLSGHGFKFTSALGEVLADLAMEGEAHVPISFLSLSRFATG
jgi:sarcosine oxidase